MKKETHPNYGPVLFIDNSTGDQWVGASTKLDGPKMTVDGQTLPVVRLEISSFSHPFYTGQKRFLDAEGRVDRFNKRFQAAVVGKKAGKAAKAKATAAAAPQESAEGAGEKAEG